MKTKMTSFKRSQVCTVPALSVRSCSRPLMTHTFAGDTQTQFWLSLCGVSGSWCSQGLRPLSVSGGKEFDSKHDFTPPTVLLRLLLCPWMRDLFLWWDSIFSNRWLFSSEFLFWSSRERRQAHVLLLFHLMPHTEKKLYC